MTYSEAPSYIRWFWDSKNERWKTSLSGMEDFVTQNDNILETADEELLWYQRTCVGAD
jgi:hypothetical protein